MCSTTWNMMIENKVGKHRWEYIQIELKKISLYFICNHFFWSLLHAFNVYTNSCASVQLNIPPCFQSYYKKNNQRNIVSLNWSTSSSVFYLTTPFSSPPAITLTDTPSGWLENATEQMISRQWTWPIKSPLIVHSLRSLPPPTAHTKRTSNDYLDYIHHFSSCFTLQLKHGNTTDQNHTLWRYRPSSHWPTLRSLDSCDPWDSVRNTT